MEVHLFWPIHRQEWPILWNPVTFLTSTRNQQYSHPPTYSRLTQPETLKNVTRINKNLTFLRNGILTLSRGAHLGPVLLEKPLYIVGVSRGAGVPTESTESHRNLTRMLPEPG